MSCLNELPYRYTLAWSYNIWLLPPCCLVPSKTTLTVAIASETRDVICMSELWMDEHEMRWVYASRGSVLTWQREARLSVQQVQEGSCSTKAIQPEYTSTNRLLPIAETVWGCMKTFWCNCKVKAVDHWLSASQQHVSGLANYCDWSLTVMAVWAFKV